MQLSNAVAPVRRSKGNGVALLIIFLMGLWTSAVPVTRLCAQTGSGQRDAAIRLLQTATTQSALGNNPRAEEACRQLLTSPALLPHVDPVQVKLLLASLLHKQRQHRAAYDLLVETLKAQRESLGDDHSDVDVTLQAFGGLVIDLTWSKAIAKDLPKEQYADATALAKEAVAMGLPHAYWSLALLQLRQEDKASLESITRSLQRKRDGWLGQFSILALALAENGQDALARDAQIVACDRAAKTPSLYEPIRILRDEAAERLQLATAEVVDRMSRKDLVESYTRLIEAYPGQARLHAWRASHLQCLDRWDEALADLNRTVELEPTDWRHAESRTALQLFVAEDEQTKVCKDFLHASFEELRYGKLADGGARMDLVLLCSLAEAAELDRTAILKHAEEIRETTPTRPFLELGYGMALYRCGRFEEALDTLPGADVGGGSGKDRGLPILFRAMAFHQLGEKRAAKSHLQDAVEYFDSMFGGGRVTRMPYQNAGTHYCILSMALREAKALIGEAKD